MSVSTAIVLQLAIFVYGLLVIIFGALFAYIGRLSVNGKFKPGESVSVRFTFFNFSRNYKLFNQDKYWYDIHRYAGKRMQYLAIPEALLGVAIIVLPADPQLKIWAGLVVTLVLFTVGFTAVGVLTYRYANRLITQ